MLPASQRIITAGNQKQIIMVKISEIHVFLVWLLFIVKKHIPNIITALNLSCGFISILFVLAGDPITGAYIIFLAAIFDFFDGFAARLLGAYSEIGKQLDSLADMVSFGVAPALLFVTIIKSAIELPETNAGISGIVESFVVFSPVLLVLASGFRLARFNIDENQEREFIGLPTPASGIFFSSLAFIQDGLLTLPVLLFPALALFFSFLLVSRIPMYSFKARKLTDPGNLPAVFLILCGLVILLVFSVKYIFVIIILYIFISLVLPVFSETKQ